MASASSKIAYSITTDKVNPSDDDTARSVPPTANVNEAGLKAHPPQLSGSVNSMEQGFGLAETAKRSLSLRDAKSSAEGVQKAEEVASKDDTFQPDIPVLGRLSTDVDIIANDPSSQFPSPSSGFVPPVTQEDFRLPQIIPPASNLSVSQEVEIDRVKTPTIRKDFKRESNESSTPGVRYPDDPSSSLSIPIEKKTLLNRTGISQDSSQLSLLSSSSSSSSFDDGHSQAISARSSPSTVASQRRRSSASPISGISASQTGSNMIPIKIRDFAFGEIDPRHVGAREITVSSIREEEYATETNLDEDVEGGYEAQQESGLPIGLYHAAYDFAAESEHELSVQAGEKLRLIGHVEGGWAIVIRLAPGQEDAIIDEDSVPRTDKGLVPEAYLEWLA